MGGDRITIPPRTGDSGPIGHGASPPVAAAPGAGRTIPPAWMRALLILSLLVLAVPLACISNRDRCRTRECCGYRAISRSPTPR
jgi:hypothetical protein